MKFNEIVSRHENAIYNGYYKIQEIGTGYIYLLDKTDFRPKVVKKISLNDLLSPESGFLQAVKWLQKETGRIDTYNDGTSDSYYRSDRQYHAMIMSIMTNEEKIRHMEENILID